MRLFIAYDMPPDIREKLVTLQKRIGNEAARIKWVEPGNIHLTLKFIGEVEDSKADEIRDALKRIKFRPFISSVSGFGAFPSESYARVLWVGLKPADRIGELHERIGEALMPLGFGKEERFQPHVTLGRVNAVADKGSFIKNIQELKRIEIGEPFTFGSFRLKKSTLTPSGPIYEDVEIFEAK